MLRSDTNNEETKTDASPNESGNESSEDNFKGDQYLGMSSVPVTPKMLIKALQHLKKKSFKGLYFTPIEVTVEILRKYPSVEQDLDVLLLEVTDKLICASAAGLVGTKHDSGYYAFDLRQEALKSDTRSELMFWLFYKKILNKKMEEEKKKGWTEEKMSRQSACGESRNI